MPNDADFERTAEETRETLEMFARIEAQAAEFEQKKEAFRRQFGFEFEKVANWAEQQDTSQAMRTLTPAERDQLELEKSAFESDLARDLQIAEQRFREQKQRACVPPPRINRVRDMI